VTAPAPKLDQFGPGTGWISSRESRNRAGSCVPQ
jgi:hypothetical protein